ncbi:unnamed protein product [Effrenium voratum]|nr:unnamed protein product [Effrenium voratum]
MFRLELSGDGVLEVPLSRRRIGPMCLRQQPDCTLFVGRKHQPELHKQAVAPECLRFMSRDHFSIAWEVGFRIRPLTSNPIWRLRRGAAIELQRNSSEDLVSGDRIALGTGSDNSPDAAVQSLCWLFTVEGTELQADEGCRTPPSPGGAGPRVSEEWAIRVVRSAMERPVSPESPMSPARERLLSEGGPKAKSKSRSGLGG